jgi:nitrogenase molybdenum-cofactor synthesis protein NifE
MIVTGTSVKKSTAEDKERVKDLLGKDAHMWESLAPREMYRMLRESEADIMLSGGRTQFVALKARMPWLDANQERHQGYAGYEGMVALVREIDRLLANSIWEQVRTLAPWDRSPLSEGADMQFAGGKHG